MQVELDILSEISLECFADAHNLKMVVKERVHEVPGSDMRFYAYFDRVEIMEKGCLVSNSGNGSTIDGAMDDYAKQISRKKVAINAGRPERRNVQVPVLIREKSYDQNKS